jgi:low affinity Fe/Cu permease
MKDKKNFFERFANAATHFTGSSAAFLIAAAIVLVWGITGPVFDFSETWQLIINTGTTIVTFLMVFLIQKSQNKDSKAIHLKLNELISAMPTASNRIVDIEDLSEEELDHLHGFYLKIAELAKKDNQLKRTHNRETALKSHIDKSERTPGSKSKLKDDSGKKSN